jgi:adenylate cyclase
MPQIIASDQLRHEARAEKTSCLVWLGLILLTYTVFMLGFRQTVTAELVQNISLLVVLMVPAFSLLAILIHRGIYFESFRYLNIFLQVTLVSGAILFDNLAQGPAYALSSMPPMAYALVPMITAFRLQPGLGVFAGAVSAMQFMLLYVFVLKPDAGLIAQIPSLGLDVTIMKAFVLFALGVASALAANSLRNYFENYSKSQEMRFRLQNNFGRFVSPEIVQQIEQSRDGNIPASEQEASIVFGDIRGFTRFASDHSTSEVANLLNRFFGIVCRVVEEEGGMVNKFLGDGYLAFFGLYNRQDNCCAAAARAVLRIQQESQSLLKPLGLEPGAAANHGTIITGEVGSEGRCEFTAIGIPVNLAARLEGMNSVLGTRFLATRDFLDHLGGNEFNTEYRGEFDLKGIAGKVAVHEIRS